MSKKNQLADLRRLISLSPGDMRQQVTRYVYEDPHTVLRLLFKLITTERFTNQKKDNILTLTKFILERYRPGPLPDCVIDELNKVLITNNISDLDKAIVLSAFEPEDLINRLEGFENFLEGFSDIKESFEDFIIEQIQSNPSMLYDIYKVVIEKSKPEGLLAMISDLAGSEDLRIVQFLEVLTYHSSRDVSLNALRAIEMASTQEAINTLYNISCHNATLKEEAEHAYISLMHELPLPTGDFKSAVEIQEPEVKGKYIDLWVSLIDGNGAMSAFIGKRFIRNNYFFASILMKLSVGVKDTIIMTNLTKEGYEGIKKEYFSELSYYPVKEDYLLKLVKHYLKKGLSQGSLIPIEMVILKNILGWKDFEPMEYFFETPELEPLKYYPRDLFQFPFETWWMHDTHIYKVLRPYKGKQVFNIPDGIFFKIAMIFLEYARKEIVPMCELCADIISNSNYHKRTRLMRLFLEIRDEVLNPPKSIFQSTFLNVAVVASINNTLHNLSMGIETPELIE